MILGGVPISAEQKQMNQQKISRRRGEIPREWAPDVQDAPRQSVPDVGPGAVDDAYVPTT